MRIAAYCRVSTDAEEQLDSLKNQKEFFTQYAQNNHHTLVRLYADEGISGTSLKRRTEFQRLMSDAALGLFEMVVVKDISRFARNTVDFLQSIRSLKAMGINTIFLTANMNSLGDSEFILTIFGAMAQEESANLSKRVKFGKKITAQRGRVPHHVYGYDHIDNYTLAINPTESDIVKEIFRLYVEEGCGCRRIALKLNAMGACTKFGYDWNTTGIKRILKNSIYCGKYMNHKYEIEDYLTGKQVRIPEDQQFHHDKPEWAIVSKETFEEAQKILAQRQKQYENDQPFKKGRYSNRHVFSTLIKCGCCGASYCRKHYSYVKTRVYWKCTVNDQQTSHICSNTVKVEEDELLAAIRDYLSKLIEDKQIFIKSILDGIQANVREQRHTTDRKDLEAAKRRLLKKREKYQDMYANDVISITELKSKMRDIDRELATVEEQMVNIMEADAIERRAEDMAKAYLMDIEAFLQLENVTNMDMRRVIDHITVNPTGKVEICIKNIGKA